MLKNNWCIFVGLYASASNTGSFKKDKIRVITDYLIMKLECFMKFYAVICAGITVPVAVASIATWVSAAYVSFHVVGIVVSAVVRKTSLSIFKFSETHVSIINLWLLALEVQVEDLISGNCWDHFNIRSSVGPLSVIMHIVALNRSLPGVHIKIHIPVISRFLRDIVNT
jgi:hypothetical protein